MKLLIPTLTALAATQSYAVETEAFTPVSHLFLYGVLRWAMVFVGVLAALMGAFLKRWIHFFMGIALACTALMMPLIVKFISPSMVGAMVLLGIGWWLSSKFFTRLIVIPSKRK